jgi:hypothetical protein
MHYERDQRHDQQQVNETSSDVERKESEHPRQQQNDKKYEEHVKFSPYLICASSSAIA